LLAIAILGLMFSVGVQAQAASPTPSAPSFHAAVVGADVVIEGSGYLRAVELPKDGLLRQPGSDMDSPAFNPGAPSTPRAVMFAGRCRLSGAIEPIVQGQCPGGPPDAVAPGPGCQAVPQLPGALGFSALCPVQPGGGVRVGLGEGADVFTADAGEHPEGHGFNDTFGWLRAPLAVLGGAGDDRINVSTGGSVSIDGGQGDDRITIADSRPATLIGGAGDDEFGYDELYDRTPRKDRGRIRLDCGPGADFVLPNRRFHHGRGCPARPPRLTAAPLRLRGVCRARCIWRGSHRIVVTVRNATSRPVTLRSARLAIRQWDDEPDEMLFVTLARRKRLRVPARGSTRIAMPAGRWRVLKHQLGEFIGTLGCVPALELSGAVVEADGDRTISRVTVRFREGLIKGRHPFDCPPR
jgi:hypothetical protein